LRLSAARSACPCQGRLQRAPHRDFMPRHASALRR
jgi:hypothetical protein